MLPLLAPSCSVDDGVLGRMRGAAGADGRADAATNPTSNCGALTPTVEVPLLDGSGTSPMCTGRIASTRFTNALCVCGDVRADDYLATRGFDSSLGGYVEGQADDSGAAVAINGNYQALGGYTDIGGSMSIAGLGAITCVGYLAVRGDFRAAGDVTVAGYTNIARDAWLQGSFLGVGPLTVGGELHRAGSVTALPLHATGEFVESVNIGGACPCEPREGIDVAELVRRAESNNDNARLGIQPSALQAGFGGRILELPCGRYYFDRISGTEKVTIRSTGSVAVFVGDISLDADLEVQSTLGAEIDLFVLGDLSVSGNITVGSLERPSSGRIYVGGARDIVPQDPLIGNLYAPHARVVVEASLTVWGAIFSNAFSSKAATSFFYDRSIGDAGRNCAVPPPSGGACSKCGSCYSGTACVGGQCSACRADVDCCSQNICANGRCVPLITIL